MTTIQMKERNSDLQNRARILVKCPDKPGIVAILSTFLNKHNANIIESNQYSSDPENGMFFIRIEYNCDNLVFKRDEMEKEFATIAEQYEMTYSFHYCAIRPRAAIYVSKETHCLMELLWE